MKTSNNISLSLTGLAVKTYMFVAILWSKSNEAYHSLQSSTKEISLSGSKTALSLPKA